MLEKTNLTCCIALALMATVAVETSVGQVIKGPAHPPSRAYLYDRAPNPDTVDGVSVPNRRFFGYYPTQWRTWPTPAPGASGTVRQPPRPDLDPFEVPVEERGNLGAAAPAEQQRPAQVPAAPSTRATPQPQSSDQDAAPRPPQDSEQAPPIPPLDLRSIFEPDTTPTTPPLRGPFRQRPSGSSPGPLEPLGQVPEQPRAVGRYAAISPQPTKPAEALRDRAPQRTIAPSSPPSPQVVVHVATTAAAKPAVAINRVQPVSFTRQVTSDEPAQQPTMIVNPLR